MNALFFLVTFSATIIAAAESGASSAIQEALAKVGTKPTVFCPSSACSGLETDMEKWDCLKSFVFAPIPKGKNPHIFYYLKHDCGGVGWGNNIRAISNGFALASILGRRLIVEHFEFNAMFNRPKVIASSEAAEDEFPEWDYGLQKSKPNSPGSSDLSTFESWSYEKYGRHKSDLIQWSRNLSAIASGGFPGDYGNVDTEYSNTVMRSGICGGDRAMLTEMKCLDHSMPNFISCANGTLRQKALESKPGDISARNKYIEQNALISPFMAMICRQPSKKMQEMLVKVRTKVGLPKLSPGSEPEPGQWALHTPGYYILGLHVRNHPIGFERLSVDINKGPNKQRKLKMLEMFWQYSRKAAERAAFIAKCRGEELLIYFATDDAPNMRPIAEKKLSSYGRVVFGLDEKEVGHMSSGWGPKDQAIFQRIQKFQSLDGESSYPNKETIEELEKREQEFDRGIQAGTNVPPNRNESLYFFDVDHSPESKKIHAAMAITEWFILAQCNWLIGVTGSSYAETAGGLGLSEMGFMERLDMISTNSEPATTMRKDWQLSACIESLDKSVHFTGTCEQLDYGIESSVKSELRRIRS